MAGILAGYEEGFKPVGVTATSHFPYGVEKGAYNQVAFKPVSTTALRLEIAIRSNSSTGIQKWHVE